MLDPAQLGRKVRIGIVGVGNCASSLIQGLTYYRDRNRNEPLTGLMSPDIGGYGPSDIERGVRRFG